MASKKESKDNGKKRGRPAATPEGRENQLVSLAVDLVEEQLRDGTATSQVITHYLKLGTERERLERDKLSAENELLSAKVEALASQQRTEELYAEALKAMRTYSGNDGDEPGQEDYYED